MLFILILIQKIIALCIFSKFNLSMKGSNSQTYQMYLRISLLSLLSLLILQIRFHLLFNKHNEPIRSTIFDFNKLVIELDIEIKYY